MTTRTAASGVRATEEIGSEPISAPFDFPPLQGTHGDYDVGAEIARGGMGRIVEAHDRRQDRPVALKLLLRPDAVSAKRFAREAWITGRLQHPAIIPLYESGRWETGEPFFAMKLVRGASLADVLRSKGTYEERLALLPHLIALTEALAYAHGEGVVHRDLKPSNVLVGSFGETVVIDWGLAKLLADTGEDAAPAGVTLEVPASASLTAEGHVVGTPHYMAPEQARGKKVDTRADVYSLGACLYHALSGAPPYGATTGGREAIVKLLAEPPEPLAMLVPGAAPDLVAIVAKAMARDAKDRYATAKEMAEDLQRFAAGRLVAAHAYTLGELVKRWIAKRRALLEHAETVLTQEIGREEREPTADSTGYNGPGWPTMYRSLVRTSLGDLKGAVSDARSSLEARSKWAAARPGDQGGVGRTLDAREMVMVVADRRGNYESIFSEIRRILEGFTELKRSDPDQVNWLAQRAEILTKLCDIQRRLDDIGPGHDECQTAIQNLEESLRTSPAPLLKDKLARALNAAAAMQLARNDAQGALREFTRSGELIDTAFGLHHSTHHDDALVDALTGIARSSSPSATSTPLSATPRAPAT